RRESRPRRPSQWPSPGRYPLWRSPDRHPRANQRAAARSRRRESPPQFRVSSMLRRVCHIWSLLLPANAPGYRFLPPIETFRFLIYAPQLWLIGLNPLFFQKSVEVFVPPLIIRPPEAFTKMGLSSHP